MKNTERTSYEVGRIVEHAAPRRSKLPKLYTVIFPEKRLAKGMLRGLKTTLNFPVILNSQEKLYRLMTTTQTDMKMQQPPFVLRVTTWVGFKSWRRNRKKAKILQKSQKPRRLKLKKKRFTFDNNDSMYCYGRARSTLSCYRAQLSERRENSNSRGSPPALKDRLLNQLAPAKPAAPSVQGANQSFPWAGGLRHRQEAR